MNTILVIYTVQFFLVFLFEPKKNIEKNENFDLPYVYINYTKLFCLQTHKTKLTIFYTYIQITKEKPKPNNTRKYKNEEHTTGEKKRKTKINLSKNAFSEFVNNLSINQISIR